MIRFAAILGSRLRARALLFQAPSLGVGLRAVPFRLHDDIAGLLVGQVLVLLVKVLDLVGLLGRDTPPVGCSALRLVICHHDLLSGTCSLAEFGGRSGESIVSGCSSASAGM